MARTRNSVPRKPIPFDEQVEEGEASICFHYVDSAMIAERPFRAAINLLLDAYRYCEVAEHYISGGHAVPAVHDYLQGLREMRNSASADSNLPRRVMYVARELTFETRFISLIEFHDLQTRFIRLFHEMRSLPSADKVREELACLTGIMTTLDRPLGKPKAPGAIPNLTGAIPMKPKGRPRNNDAKELALLAEWEVARAKGTLKPEFARLQKTVVVASEKLKYAKVCQMIDNAQRKTRILARKKSQ